MRFDYINPFVDSAKNVMESLMPVVITQQSVTLNSSISARGISATIFLAGEVNGRVLMDIDPQMAKRIAGEMNGIEFEYLDHLAVDTICELANIIIGKAVTQLNNRGFRFKTSPPCFFIGEKIYHGLESMCISLSTDWGDISIQADINDAG